MRLFPRMKLTLQSRLMMAVTAVVLLQSLLVGGFTFHFVSSSLEEQIGLRALSLARSVAAIPQIRDGLQARDVSQVQPVAEEIRQLSGARFVVVGDSDSVRYSHPLPERLGKKMVGGDNDRALIDGESYVSRAVGSLGPSMRGKAPIFDAQGAVIGIVSVGFMLDRVDQLVSEYLGSVQAVAVLALLLSIVGAVLIARYFKRAIFGLEPEAIARLLEERDATLASLREGLIAVDAGGVVSTVNHAAVKSLQLDDSRPLVGRPLAEVLPESRMLDVLEDDRPQFDEEIWLNGRAFIANRVPVRVGGQIRGVVSSFRPKDELEEVSRRLTRIRQYAESLRSQAHDYSNKLHTIAGLIQIDARDEALELIGQEARGVESLIRLLVEAVPDPVLAGCLLGKHNRARELGLALRIDPESHMAELPRELSREQLVSLLGNLLDNAFEATLRREDSPREVLLSMTDLGRELIFEIEDNGPGIPADQRERIFHKGVSSKAREGHGLGLYKVRGILDQVGGTLLLEDGDSGGTRVTVYLPKEVRV